MNFSKKHLVPGLIGNLLVAIIGFVGIAMIFFDNIIVDKAGAFLYFTTLSNLFVAVVSLILFILYIVSLKKDKNYVSEFWQVLKMISVVSVAITFTMVVIFLAPADPSFNFFGGSQLFLHLLTPLAAVFSFIFFEYATKIRFRFFFTPIIFVLVYGVFYIVFAFTAKEGTLVDWYGFMFQTGGVKAPVDPSKFNYGTFFLFLGESLGGAVVFGFVFWLVNKICNLIFIGYTVTSKDIEYSDEIVEPEKSRDSGEHSAIEEPVEEPVQKKKTSSKSRVSAPKKYKDAARVYHISRSKFVSRSWQVKLAQGEKAIKIFPTQAEAIDYAKKLVRSQGGSIRIHSMKGQLRK